MRAWLVALRKKKGMTQVEVSKLAGIPQPSYCHIERGCIEPRSATAKKIASVLGFDWTKFYEDE